MSPKFIAVLCIFLFLGSVSAGLLGTSKEKGGYFGSGVGGDNESQAGLDGTPVGPGLGGARAGVPNSGEVAVAESHEHKDGIIKSALKGAAVGAAANTALHAISGKK